MNPSILLPRMLGAFLLVLAGTGGGLAVYSHQAACGLQLHTFARLLGYLQGTLSYQALTGEELLQRAALYPEFAKLGLSNCCTLEDLPLPSAVSDSLKMEIRSGLEQLALEPRASACTTLQRLAALTEEEAQRKQNLARQARSLYPRLGACAGVLTAILLW